MRNMSLYLSINPEKLHEFHNGLLFLPEWMKIEKFEKFVAKLHDKTEYVINKINFKKSIQSWISFENIA